MKLNLEKNRMIIKSGLKRLELSFFYLKMKKDLMDLHIPKKNNNNKINEQSTLLDVDVCFKRYTLVPEIWKNITLIIITLKKTSRIFSGVKEIDVETR